jgi:hypothetical protein
VTTSTKVAVQYEGGCLISIELIDIYLLTCNYQHLFRMYDVIFNVCLMYLDLIVIFSLLSFLHLFSICLI